MFEKAITLLVLSLCGLTLAVLVLPPLAETLLAIWRRYATRGMSEAVVIAVFFLCAIYVGGSKTNSAPQGGDCGLMVELDEFEGLLGEGGESEPSRLSTNQCAAGFALLSKAVTNTAWLAVPSNAVTHAPWTRYGLAEDTFWLPATNWGFVLGTNAVEGAHVSSSGTLSFDPATPKGSPRAAALPDGDAVSFLAPLQASLGTVPPQGRFWHAVTPSNSVLMTWQDLYAGRDTNSPITFQAELYANGDFTYRYAFTNALALTNFVIGAQHNGGGETCALDATNRLANGLELRWRAFGMLDPGVDDHDADGLSTYDEVMTYGTDPAMPDTDLDGLGDAEEVALGAPPLDPDWDGDGIADGLDPRPAVWDNPSGDSDNDGLPCLYELTHGLDPDSPDGLLDTDGDGWEDWKERMAGTGTNDIGSVPVDAKDWLPALFDVTVTLDAALPCNVLLSIGDRTLVLRQAGSNVLTLAEGVAHPVTLRAPSPCRASLSVTLSSPCAAFQNPGAAFTGGADLHGGRPVPCGLIAQPKLAIRPDAVCFHADHPETVAAGVAPAMAGARLWEWQGGTLSASTWAWANISWGAGSDNVALYFTAAGASQPRYTWLGVSKCSAVESGAWCRRHGCEEWFCPCDDPEEGNGVFCGYHGQTAAACRSEFCPTHNRLLSECPKDFCHAHDCPYAECEPWWCHIDGCYRTECDHPTGTGDEGGSGNEVGDPVFGAWDEPLAAVNNDDDDASETPDAGESPVSGENDLAVIWPLGVHSGTCCACPEHRRQGAESAALVAQSSRLSLYGDAGKSSAFSGPVQAGQAVYVQGEAPSAAAGGDKLVWEWLDEDDCVHRMTNEFTVLSVRMFGDLDLDGDVDAADKARHPALTNACGWAMPAATNVLRPVRLRTDVGLSGGLYTLSLSGDAGAFRVWPDAAGTNAAPLLACGQTVTNGAGGVSFLAGGDTDLFVEAVSNGTAMLTYAYAGTGDAAGISCTASMMMTAWEFEVNVSSPRLGGSPKPPPFAGQSAHVFHPDRSPETDQHAVVLYKDAVDTNFNVADFDVMLSADFKPSIISTELMAFRWEKVSGPEPGNLLASTSLSATYRNPKKGGVYRFRLTVSSGDKDLAFCEANVVLPLAGGEMDSVVRSDLAKADLLAASVREKYGRLERLESENYKRWFYWGNAGDYVGRPDSAITPSVWYYGQVDTVNRTNETYGLGAVCTWKGTPVRLAKISNFIVGYAARKIGTIKLLTKAAGITYGTINGATGNESWDKGWDLAGSGNYDTIANNLAVYIWSNEDQNDKTKKPWPNSNPPDNDGISSILEGFDYDRQYASPGLTRMVTNP